MTRRQITKHAMVQVLITAELNAWNTLMFDTWFYGADSREAYGSRNAWSSLHTTLHNIGVSEYQGVKRRNMIDLPHPVQG